MLVNEILTGYFDLNALEPCLIVRLGKCNYMDRCSLRCNKSDTWYSFVHISVNDLCELIHDSDTILFTGGEPLIQKDQLFDLVKKLNGKKLYLETNGSIELAPIEAIPYHTIVVSPKYPDMDYRLWSTYPNTVFRIIVENEEDVLTWANRIEYMPKDRVYFTPEGIRKKDILKHFENIKLICEKLNYKISIQYPYLLR